MTVRYVLDGSQVRTLEDFWRVAGESIGCGGYFGRNLDAFADCLRGGFGTPDDGDFMIEWQGHEISRRNLGHHKAARQLEMWLARCHPTNRDRMAERLAEARAGRGPTAFDWLVEIIEEELPGGLLLRWPGSRVLRQVDGPPSAATPTLWPLGDAEGGGR